MKDILDWGVDVVLWFQQFSPTLDIPFKLLTSLGEQGFFMLMLPLIYWCVDRETGRRLIILFLFSVYINQLAKALLDQPRPFEYDDRVRALVDESGGGLPSGHTQGAVVIWGFIAAQWKKSWVWALAAALMIAIPLSRIYLGVHFPTDLLGGYAMGALLLAFYFLAAPSLINWLRSLSPTIQISLATVLSIALAAVYPGEGGYGVMVGGALLGLSVGLAFERRLVRFTVDSRWLNRLGAYVIGVTILFCIYFGLRALFAEFAPTALWRFVRYALVGFWGAFGAPWLFVKLGFFPVEKQEARLGFV